MLTKTPPTNDKHFQQNKYLTQTIQKQTILTKKRRNIPEDYWHDWKHLGAELRATSLTIGPWYKETSQKASEKRQKIINKRKVLQSFTKLVCVCEKFMFH